MPRLLPTICGTALSGRRHVCAFFSDPVAAYPVMGPYVREGITRHERVLNVIPTGARELHTSRLAAERVAVEDAELSGQLIVKTWDESYLSGGRFAPDEMLQRVIEAVRSAHNDAYRRLRCWGDMSWAKAPQHVDEALRYERECDVLSMRFPDDVFVCCYDPQKLPGRVVAELASIHPLVIFDGTLYENRS
jgi:hypothetical protein